MAWWRKALKFVAASSRLPAPLPTADYYFLGGVDDLVAPGCEPSVDRPIVRLGPNTWAHADRLVIIRYLTQSEAVAVEAGRWRSVHYVVDDLLPAVAMSDDLPADYRMRLVKFTETMLPRILALRPVIVAPSQAILDVFAGFQRLKLDPCFLALREGLPPPMPFDGRLEIGFLGTRSHAATLPLLARLAEDLDDAGCEARLHLYFGKHLPRSLSDLRTIVNHDPVPWPEFADFCRRTQFHIAVAPVQRTSFAMARSITKLMDHAAVGAAGIYSDRPPFSSVVTHGRDGILSGDAATYWADAVLGLVGDPTRMAQVACAGSALAARLGDPVHVRRFWIEALGIEKSAA